MEDVQDQRVKGQGHTVT